MFERSPFAEHAASGQIPLAERHIVARRINRAAMRHHGEHVFFVLFNCADNGAGRQIPDENPLVT